MSLGSERGSARPLDQTALEPNEVYDAAVLTPKFWLCLLYTSDAADE